MQIELFSFSKRSNSTLTPSSSGTEVTATLKDSTSIYNPSFLLSGNSVADYNYLKWGSRYYYITNAIYINTLQVIEIRCNMDILATYKSAIQNTSAFVAYSASSYDVNIPDRRLSTESEGTGRMEETQVFSANPRYVLNIMSGNGAQTVVVNETNFRNICNEVVTDNFFNTMVKTITDGNLNALEKKLNSVNDCISSAHYVPIAPTSQTDISDIQLMDYSTGVSGYVPAHITRDTFSLTIPWQYSDFRNRSEYTNLLIYLVGYGVVDLNPDEFIGQDTINVVYTFDAYSGGLTYMIGRKYKFDTNISAPVAIGISNNNATGTLAAASAAAVSFATLNPAGLLLSAFNVALSSVQRSGGTIGSTGGTNNFDAEPTYCACMTFTHNTTVEPSSVTSVMGRPLNRVVSLSGLSGYVQTVDASVNASAPDYIIDNLNSALNGGIYLE